MEQLAFWVHSLVDPYITEFIIAIIVMANATAVAVAYELGRKHGRLARFSLSVAVRDFLRGRELG